MLERKYSIGSYRYGFNGQEKSNEIKGEGKSYGAEFWEYDPRLGKRWNIDPRSNPGISVYSVVANNPIWFNDPLGDTLRPYAVAQKMGRELQGSNTSTDAQTIGDYTVKGVYKSVKGKAVGSVIGYQAYKNGRLDYEMSPGDIEDFKSHADLYSFAANAINQTGSSDEVRKVGVGIGSNDWGYAWQGVKEENARAWKDPVFIASFLLSFANAATDIALSKRVPIKFTNTSKGKLKNFEVQGNYSATSIFNDIKNQYRGKLKVINSSATSTTIEINSSSAHFRVELYLKSKSTSNPTIKYLTLNTKGEWRTREAYRFNNE